MRLGRFLVFGLLFLSCASTASAWCVKCVYGECWMTSDAGAVKCYPIISGGGCLTSGSCAAGSTGCPEGPHGCLEENPVARVRSCDAVRFASVWKIDSVVLRHGKTATAVARIAKR